MFVVVVMVFQNRQVIVTSFGLLLVQWGRLLEFLQRLGEDRCQGRREWRVKAVLLLKKYMRDGAGVDAHEGMYFVW